MLLPSITGPLLVQPVSWPGLDEQSLSVSVLRLDQVHPIVSGNKWFKLKFFLEEAIQRNYPALLTWGGAYSNHIVATAYAAWAAGLRSIGLIRGEMPSVLSPALKDALDYGMQLEFIPRTDYARKTETEQLEKWKIKYPDAYFVPEGGAGQAGVRGMAALSEWFDARGFSHLAVAIGTGTSFIGLANAFPNLEMIGIPVIKGFERLADQALLNERPGAIAFERDYHFGGYARHTPSLTGFMNAFYGHTSIPSDFVYTAKLFYAVMDLAAGGRFSRGSRILMVHTGGLQGNRSLPAGTLNF